jgi:signal transduction histidine kinase
MIRQMKKNWAKVVIFLTIFAAATFLVAHYSHALLVSPAQLASTVTHSDNYSWSVAQFQVQFERMHNQVTRYASEMDHDPDALRLRYQVLRSKFQLMTSQSSLPNFTAKPVLHYRESLDRINQFMQELDLDIVNLKSNTQIVSRLVERFDEVRDIIDILSNAARSADLLQREAMLADFSEKRRTLYFGVMVLWAMFVVGVALYLLNYYRGKYLTAQNEAALEAERKAEAALRDAIFTKNTILGTISHELKTPLQTIISSIDLLAKRTRDPRDVVVIDRLTGAAERMEAQMEDLTDYARLGAGKLELRRIEFDPGELLERLVNEFKDQASRSGLDLVIRRKKRAILVASDARRIEQIAANLITNAIKYTSTGRIQVSIEIVRHGAEKLHLIVEDTGPGISEDKLPTLFEPFTQLDQSTTRKYDGVGMGLAIVRRLVDLFGGTIEVQSIIGRGTRFDVVLPVQVISGDVAVTAGASRTDEPLRHRILLVDDNAEVRVAMNDILTEIGYVCDVAAGGKVALQKLATHSYDAILLDISMPEMDGFEVATAVRDTLGNNRYIPIIALSAYSLDVGLPEQRDHFTGHIAKPVRMETLRNYLEKILKK